MRRAVFIKFIAVSLVALAVCGIVAAYTVTGVMIEKLQQDMMYILRLVDEDIDYEADLATQTEYVNNITMTKDTRITIIDKNGMVITDTQADNIEDNHSGREEIISAMRTGQGKARRFSQTMRRDMMYVCIKSNHSDYYVRLSMPSDVSASYVNAVMPSIVASIAIALLVSALLAGNVSQNISEPLTEISEKLSGVPLGKITIGRYRYDELNTIAAAVEDMSADVQSSLERLRYERNKIEYILNNMSEGLVLIGSDKTVITINETARKVLGCTVRGSGRQIMYYTHNLDIIEGVEKCIEDREKRVFDIQTDDKRIYAVYITCVLRGVLSDEGTGASILMIDVTEVRNAQKMRQEFFSNVSHEMKTPITSIRGFADLMESGMVTDENQKKEYLMRIKKETENMTNLINDILMISRLEAQDVTKTDIEINLADIIEDVCRSVEPMIKTAELTLILECDDVCAKIDMSHMNQLANNLIVNAIKYNKNGGSIIVRLKKEMDEVIFEVEDTGIGIPYEAQARVFERFYRVDKGRSRTMGGTGLGLSIVKHIVQFYNGKAEVKSEVGKGTVITVRIPDDEIS